MSHSVDFWNRNFPPGTPVAYFFIHHSPDHVETVTAGQAFKRGKQAFIVVEGIRGAVDLDRLCVPGVTEIPEVSAPPLCRGHKPKGRELGFLELEAWTLARKTKIAKCPDCGYWLFPEEM